MIRTVFFLLFLVLPATALAQSSPAQHAGAAEGQTWTISSVEVEGVDNDNTRDFLLRASGLRVAQAVTLPGDPAFAVAIRAIHRLNQFAHVEIRQEKLGQGESSQPSAGTNQLAVVIDVTPFPNLNAVTLEGVKNKEAKKLERSLPFIKGLPVQPADLARARRILASEMEARGYPYARIETLQMDARPGTVDLKIQIEPGPRLHVDKITFDGNEGVSARALQRTMATKSRKWWQFWRKARFEATTLQADLERVEAYLHEQGLFDARILQDTLILNEKDAGIEVHIQIAEGKPYYIRSVHWEGNTLFDTEQLNAWLGIAPGDRYNLRKLEENLYGNASGQDVSSQYMNRGYMRFGVAPRISVAGKDALDLYLDIQEGDVYTFGEIEIAGNYNIKDHVVRRELFSIPGEQFSRTAIQESIRRLAQSGRFSTYALSQGPALSIDEAKKQVNLRYQVEESSFPRPQLTGSIGQFGLVLGLNMTYNNFSLQEAFKKSAWRPLPSGDGQEIGLQVQTSGKAYQQYGLTYVEPWLRGKPAPFGVSTSYTHIGADVVSSSLTGSFNTYTAQLWHERRLKWPSPFFNIGTTLEYRTFNNTLYDELPNGHNAQLSVTQSLTRNTTDHPVFATSGSLNRLSVEVGLPVGSFIQFHKWRFQSGWNVPLTRNRRLSFNVSADLGYIGSLNGDPVTFERFVLGGSPLESQGLSSTPILGTEVVYFRGYPLGAFDNAEGPVGQRLLAKYATELRWMAVKKPQFQIMPYLFFDAANTWNSFDAFQATSLFKSTGAGLRMQVPMLGMVEVVYGRNLDAYTPPDGSDTSGRPAWGLQFSIGRSFNF